MATVSVMVLVRITNHRSGIPNFKFHLNTNMRVNTEPTADINIETFVKVLVSYPVKQVLYIIMLTKNMTAPSKESIEKVN
jgi:hypothetical protein